MEGIICLGPWALWGGDSVFPCVGVLHVRYYRQYQNRNKKEVKNIIIIRHCWQKKHCMYFTVSCPRLPLAILSSPAMTSNSLCTWENFFSFIFTAAAVCPSASSPHICDQFLLHSINFTCKAPFLLHAWCFIRLSLTLDSFYFCIPLFIHIALFFASCIYLLSCGTCSPWTSSKNWRNGFHFFSMSFPSNPVDFIQGPFVSSTLIWWRAELFSSLSFHLFSVLSCSLRAVKLLSHWCYLLGKYRQAGCGNTLESRDPCLDSFITAITWFLVISPLQVSPECKLTVSDYQLVPTLLTSVELCQILTNCGYGPVSLEKP